jgi:hypothetical protein
VRLPQPLIPSETTDAIEEGHDWRSSHERRGTWPPEPAPSMRER